MSSEYNNPLDNSDVPIRDNKHSAVGGMFESVDQASQYKLYLENLKLVAELKDAAGLGAKKLKMIVGKKPDGSPAEKEVTIADLVPVESEFERIRRVTISNLNKMASTDQDKLRQWMARFGTDNLFELSGRISSYIMDKKRRDDAFSAFSVWN